MTKPVQKNINGILLLDKPLNYSSNQALQCVKRLFSAKKAGHTGSLDPLATGMLPICFGEATKFSQFLLESNKCYQVTAQLGVKTTTGDAEGEVIATKPVPPLTREHIESILQQFTGLIDQIPPMFSALKHQGKPLYELARKGIEVERAARQVMIFELQLEGFTHDTLSLHVKCSKGTYVRTLVEDIAEKLGCGAHVIALRRSLVMPYEQSNMYTLAELEQIREQSGVDALTRYLLPAETSVEAYPSVKLSASAVFYVRMGQSVMVPQLPEQGLVRLFSEDNHFMGIGEVLGDGRVAPRRMISQPKKFAKTGT